MTDTDDISDDYHTFGELYDHRTLLFITLMVSHPQISWYAESHDDGTQIDGYFIAGMDLPTGQVTYHCQVRWLPLVNELPITRHVRAPRWDGHTAEDVLTRLREWISTHPQG